MDGDVLARSSGVLKQITLLTAGMRTTELSHATNRVILPAHTAPFPMNNDNASKVTEMLSHMVYFTLKDASDEGCQKLIDASNRLLRDSEGVTFFAVGRIGKEFQRDVNVQDFHVALNVVFDSKESHDVYQVCANHLAFIEEGKPNWEKIRIYDAYVE